MATRIHCNSTSRTLWTGPSVSQLSRVAHHFAKPGPGADIQTAESQAPNPEVMNQNLYPNKISRQFTFALTFEALLKAVHQAHNYLTGHFFPLVTSETSLVFKCQTFLVSCYYLAWYSPFTHRANSLIQSISFFFFSEHPFEWQV